MAEDVGIDLLELVRVNPVEQSMIAARTAMGAKMAGPKRPERKSETRETEPFAHFTIRAFLAVLSVLDGALEMAAWVYILREWRLRIGAGQDGPLRLTNGGLAAWGISRAVKGRAVRKLAAAGLIRVVRDGKCSLRLSVLIEA
jgi:hypothetical protein